MKIAVIGGGNMGGAIACGAMANNIVEPQNVTISHLEEKMNHFFTNFTGKFVIEDNNALAIKDADLVVVAVKPWIMEEVLAELVPVFDRSKQALVSIAAGVDFAQLSKYMMCDKYGEIAMYRLIPNTAIAIGQSVNLVCKNNSSEEQDKALFSILDALGGTFVITEDQMTPLTSLSSCGIAFAYRYIDASMRGGMEVGIDQKVALDVVMQTVKGALMMIEANGTMPQTEIDKVTTKGGITIKGLEAMEAANFSNAVIDGVKFSR